MLSKKKKCVVFVLVGVKGDESGIVLRQLPESKPAIAEPDLARPVS